MILQQASYTPSFGGLGVNHYGSLSVTMAVSSDSAGLSALQTSWTRLVSPRYKTSKADASTGDVSLPHLTRLIVYNGTKGCPKGNPQTEARPLKVSKPVDTESPS